jgi:hypothetical protein
MKTVTLATLLATTLGASTPLLADDAGRGIHVYKSPSCGCCTDWVRHLQDHGFKVTVSETENLNPIKAGTGLTPALASCHTAFIDGYVIEGHVPATDIRRLITEAPKARGLSVPGMPAGSPGMAMGGRQDPYQVLLFNDAGQTRVFAEYR